MSLKAGCKIDHDDYCAYYDDYDEYHDASGGNAKEPTKRSAAKGGSWRCSICTYDNYNSMSCCDLCGVLRHPSSNYSGNTNKKEVGDVCKDSEVSLLAKSLFASSPLQTPNKDMITQLHDEFRKLPTDLDVFRSTLASLGNYHAAIVPFMFDTPSPDDTVSSGLHSSKATVRVFTGASSAVEKNKSIKEQPGATGVGHCLNARELGQEMKNNSSNARQINHKGDVPSSSRSLGDLPELATKAKKAAMPGPLGEVDIIENLASTVENVSLNAKSGSSKRRFSEKGKSRAQYKPDKWMLPDEHQGVMTLNLAVVGHVDSGKSTLSGRLLLLQGQISKKTMHKYEKVAKLKGKGSFAFGLVLDESTEERERGITMAVAVAYFDTTRYHVVLLDSPGHKDFVPSMISGATQADAAVLVIDASMGSFEAGMDPFGGQAREHAQLIRSFGVDQIIVAINKMDSVYYSKDRFDFIKQHVGLFLRSCNFMDSLISWIPLSAIENQNLVETASDVRLKSWYHGPCLLDTIDSLNPPTRDYRKPLVMPICDVIKSHSMSQISACGKLEAGALRSGCKVLVMPSGDIGTVQSVRRSSNPCPIARAGDNVTVSIKGADAGQVMAGGVLCHPEYPVRLATHLELKVIVMDVITPILVGSQLELQIHHVKEAARVVKMLSLLDPKTGDVTKRSPRCLLSKQNAVIEVVLQGAVCVEEFSNCKAIGRAFLRTSGRTVALGIVTRIMDD